MLTADASVNRTADDKSIVQRVLRLPPMAMLTIFLALSLLAFYFPTLCGSQHYYMADHEYYFQPFTKYIAERILQGQLPLWNPYLYCGMSQIAVSSPDMFYPLNCFFLFLSYSQALSMVLLVHQLILGIGTFLLVRSFGWGTAPGVAASLILTFCGYACTLTCNHTLVTTACWLPLIFWSTRAIIFSCERGRKMETRWLAILCAVSLCMCLACGRPEIALPGLALLGALVVRDLARATACGALKWQITALLTGFLIGALPLIPLSEWIPLSPRSKGLNLTQVLMWSTNWYDWLTVVFVCPFGDLQVLGADYLNLVTTRPVFLPFVPSLYIGPIAFSLAVWGLLDSKWRWRPPLLVMLSVFVLICLGEFTPIGVWLVEHVHAFSMFRYPIKTFFFVEFLLAICAARGLMRFEKDDIGKRSENAVLIAWIFSFVVSLAFLAMYAAGKPLTLPKPYAEVPAGAERMLGTSILFGSVIGMVPYVVSRLVRAEKILRENALLMLVALLAGNLLAAAFSTSQMTTLEKFFQHRSGLARELHELQPRNPGSGRLLAAYFDPVHCPSNYRTYPGAPWTPSFYQYCREILLANSNVSEHIPEVFGYEACETGWYRNLFFDVLHRSEIALLVRKDGAAEDVTGDWPLYTFSQATATQYVATQIISKDKPVPKLDPESFKPVFENRDLNVQLYQVIDPLPRAYFTPYFQWTKNRDYIKSQILEADSNDFDPWRDTYVVRGLTTGESENSELRFFGQKIPDPPAEGTPAPQVDGNFVEHVDILVDTPEHVSLSSKSNKAGFIVLLDHFYPGWQALVDGVKRPIHCVNAESRGVYIPAGAHLIEFNYEPESLKGGYLLATIGGAIFAILLWLALWPPTLSMLKKISGQA